MLYNTNTNRGLTISITVSVLHISWAYQILASKSADKEGPTVSVILSNCNSKIASHSTSKVPPYCPQSNVSFIASHSSVLLLQTLIPRIKL